MHLRAAGSIAGRGSRRTLAYFPGGSAEAGPPSAIGSTKASRPRTADLSRVSRGHLRRGRKGRDSALAGWQQRLDGERLVELHRESPWGTSTCPLLKNSGGSSRALSFDGSCKILRSRVERT